MEVEIGIWTDGVDRTPVTGPWLALRRMLVELDKLDTPFEISYIHTDPDVEEDFYHGKNEIICTKSPAGKRALSRLELDVVVLNGIPNGALSNIFHTYPTVETVAWVHGSGPWVPDYAYDGLPEAEPPTYRRWWTKQMMKIGVRRVDHIITNSQFCRRVVTESMGAPANKAQVAPLGIDTEVFTEIPDSRLVDTREKYTSEDKATLLYVANNSPVKSPRVVIKSFHELRKRGHECELLVVGSNYENSEVSSLVDRLGLSETVTFTGYIDSQDRIAELYNVSDVFLFPSVHESFGMPVLEAMASGCPVVTSNHTALPEIAGEAGLLVDTPTDPSAVSSAVERLLESPELRAELDRAGRERASEYSWQSSAKLFRKLLSRVAEQV